MIKLINKGVYFKNGEFIKATSVDENAKKGTLSYKILLAHNISATIKNSISSLMKLLLTI